jgi:ABC-type transport system involved in multi-copper enzyme maturation permease subunit
MFWKIALGLGVFGVILGIIFIIVAVRAFYGAGFQSNTEDIAFGGLLMSIIFLVFAFLLTAVSAIFVLRNSKKEWDAKNLK